MRRDIEGLSQHKGPNNVWVTFYLYVNQLRNIMYTWAKFTPDHQSKIYFTVNLPYICIHTMLLQTNL